MTLPGAPAEVPQAPSPAAPRLAWPLLTAAGLALAALLLTEGAGGAFGLNLAVWTALYLGAVTWRARREGQPPSREGVTLLALAALFSVAFTVWAPTPDLAFLNTLALVLCLGLGSAALRFPGLARTGVLDGLGAALSSGLHLIYGLAVLLDRFPWAHLKPASAAPRTWGRVGVGALLSVPLLAVFAPLLAGADESFGRALDALLHLDVNLERSISILGHLIGWLLLTGGLVYGALLAARPSLLPPAPDQGRLGLIETGVPLGALALLFTAFAARQLPLLLGGALPDGQTYATFIREGFGQLMTVALLTAAVLRVAYALSTPGSRRRAAFRALNAAVLLPLTVILASAAQRWVLYTQAYGLSETRVLGAAFLVWVTLTLAWLAMTLWRDQAPRFAYPALLLGLGTLLVTTALNPAGLIARVNIARELSGVTNAQRRAPQQANAADLLALGPGAAPVIAAHLDVLTDCAPNPGASGVPECLSLSSLAASLQGRYGRPRDPRAWTLAHARARQAALGLPVPPGPVTRPPADVSVPRER
ncbi:hypothetical protein GCM10008956_35890 [Deinococcus arenae]|uniref:DUF4173 domain-containing protein n=1 Tax=Deinococcus arenae TaxID=1452751 RepID=A0A8H9GSE1_9DEIO|nr:DUF4173 domain-containing protein [Deinococcus arenae]AWT34215.1 hypothetical protein DM785_00590 [Deinococcus actinosclerus]GGM56946.1 hypothetical protein GCM10008956_35890 [Deinococcus arenae]